MTPEQINAVRDAIIVVLVVGVVLYVTFIQ